ncbi:MAG: response regulator transcription factor [bacterium]
MSRNETRDVGVNGGSSDETILIIEDDRSLRDGLAMNFQLRGYHVVTAADGEDGVRLAFDARPALIILDLTLPGLSGLEILSELRAREERVPVLILSARNTTNNKIEGLEMGADDYVTKPFELPELLARAEVMLRRQRALVRHQPKLELGRIVIDQAARRVLVDGKEANLSAKEFDLLRLLARSPGKPITREAILDKVWGWDFSGTTRTVNNFILSLRQKIEEDPANPRHIITVRQVGYKLEL